MSHVKKASKLKWVFKNISTLWYISFLGNYFFKANIYIFFYKFSISEIRNEKDKLINGMNEIESQIAVYDTINGDDIDKYK